MLSINCFKCFCISNKTSKINVFMYLFNVLLLLIYNSYVSVFCVIELILCIFPPPSNRELCRLLGFYVLETNSEQKGLSVYIYFTFGIIFGMKV